MGEVYRAQDTRLNLAVAIKTVQERFSERFANEARTIAALNHPHICTLYDVGPDYLVMELVDRDSIGGGHKALSNLQPVEWLALQEIAARLNLQGPDQRSAWSSTRSSD